jgi:hypothetical protein
MQAVDDPTQALLSAPPAPAIKFCPWCGCGHAKNEACNWVRCGLLEVGFKADHGCGQQWCFLCEGKLCNASE